MSDNSSPRIAFMGTPVFAELILRALYDSGYAIVTVFTQPDKPTGRDQKPTKSPVKLFAEEHSIPVEQPSRFGESEIESLRLYAPDIIIVAAYGKILPQSVLDIPRHGCVNVHASLLPRWRGASPVQNALLSGDSKSGITIMKMDAGMDTGPIIEQKECVIDPLETAASLLSKLAQQGASLLLSVLPRWVAGDIIPRPQDSAEATLCQLIDREDGRIFWNTEAESIFNQYRALFPWPGIFCFWRRNSTLVRIKFGKVSLWKSNPESSHPIGQVFEISDSIGIQTGSGVLLVSELQIEGKSTSSIADFVRGYPDFIGAILE